MLHAAEVTGLVLATVAVAADVACAVAITVEAARRLVRSLRPRR